MNEGQDYLPEGVSPGTPHAYIPPDPDTGTVYVGPPHQNGLWTASWQGPIPGSRFSDAWGCEAAVLAWALAQPAQKRLICREPLSETEVVWTELVD